MNQSWSPITSNTGSDKDTYLATLTAFLAANPPGSLGGILASGVSPLNNNSSSPEDGNSPASSSEGSGASSIGGSSGLPLAQSMAKKVATAANGVGQGADKRKLSAGADKGAIKDRRSSSGQAGKDLDVANSHTHPDLSDDDDGSDEKGKGGKTSEKRRAQNRQAQRAFRERKEKHLKELEDRVFSLEQQSTDQATENTALKQLLERLQSENERLKVYESAFSFTYAKDVSTSTSMPTSIQFGGENVPSTSSTSSPSSANPITPPTTNPDELTAYNLNFSSFNSDLSSYNNPFSPSAFMNTSGGGATDSPSSLTGSGFDANSLFFGANTTAPSPSSTAGDSTSSSSLNVSTPPDLSSNDLFSSYRDTNMSGTNGLTNGGVSGGYDALPDLDTLFGVSTAGKALEDNPLAAYLASPSPPATFGGNAAAFGLPAQKKVASPAAMTTSSAGASPASYANSPCSLYGKDKFSFDEDGLCSELQAKAVCREAAKAALQEAMKEDEKSLAAMYKTSP